VDQRNYLKNNLAVAGCMAVGCTTTKIAEKVDITKNTSEGMMKDLYSMQFDYSTRYSAMMSFPILLCQNILILIAVFANW